VVLENRYRNNHLAEASHTQPRRRIRHAGESWPEFAADIDHMAHRAHVDTSEHHNSREAACEFADGVRERNLRRQLLLGTRGH
jgi:hypothetical protein